MKMVDYEN